MFEETSDSEYEDDSLEEDDFEVARTTGNILSSSRHATEFIMYAQERWVPGSNNGYTAGRACDQYDRHYNPFR